MKKSKIIIQLLKEKYEMNANWDRSLRQDLEAKRNKDAAIMNLTNQVLGLTAENRELQDAVLPTPYQVVGTAFEDGKVTLYIYSHSNSSISRYVMEKHPLTKVPIKVPVKFGPDKDVIRGSVHIQQSAPRTGKTKRAESWLGVDPENRRIVDGNRKEAERLANQGFDVILNLLPGE